jgi:hypothetical protein
MKFRSGFVSNSSSCSFVIAIAKIKDEKKFQTWLKNHKHDDIEVCDHKGDLFVESFNGCIVSIPKDKITDGVYVKYYHGEDIYPNEDGDCDYNVGLIDFNSEVETIVNDITDESSEIFELGNYDCGAGYNG